MRAAQFLGWGSVVALIAALAVVLSGQQSELKTLLEPGQGGDSKRAQAASDSVIGKGNIAAVESDLQTLIQEAVYNNVGSARVTDVAALQVAIKHSEPQIPLGKPLGQGGISMKVFAGGAGILFCAKPNFYFVCRSFNLATRETGEGQNHDLAVAAYQARVVGAASDQAATNEDDQDVGAAESALQEAERLRRGGIR